MYDLIIIGSGPAGYTAAIKAAQLGMKVACVEKMDTLGGTCLNVGCIPSKALLNISAKYNEALNQFQEYGIIASPKIELNTMLNQKNKIVGDLTKGIKSLFKKNNVDHIVGTANFIDKNTISVSGISTNSYKAKNFIVATGSSSISLNNITIDEKRIVSSTGGLNFAEIPKKLIIVGGGYIGLELGSVWQRLGSEVTIVEFAERIVPNMDYEIGTNLFKILQKQGLKFLLNTKVISASSKNEQVSLEIQNNKNLQTEIIISDYLLVAVGRKPNTEGLDLTKLGINIDKTGHIVVDENFLTSVDNIYAVGDVIAGPMLAHKAEEEAIAAVEIINHQAGHVNYNAIPSVIYTEPEVASVGKTEEMLIKDNIKYKVGKFPFIANSRARAINHTEGFVKILSDARTDQILGAHIIGSEAGTMIAEIVVAMNFYGAAEDVARICHAHPTLNEAIKEAALAVNGKAINF